jgi:hypothetical protein
MREDRQGDARAPREEKSAKVGALRQQQRSMLKRRGQDSNNITFAQIGRDYAIINVRRRITRDSTGLQNAPGMTPRLATSAFKINQ